MLMKFIREQRSQIFCISSFLIWVGLYCLIFRVYIFQVSIVPQNNLFYVKDFCSAYLLDLSFFLCTGYLIFYQGRLKWLHITSNALGMILYLILISLNIIHLAISHHYKAGLINFSHLHDYIQDYAVLLSIGVSILPILSIMLLVIMPLTILAWVWYSIPKHTISSFYGSNKRNYCRGYAYHFSWILVCGIIFLSGNQLLNAFYNNKLNNNNNTTHSNNVLYRMLLSQYAHDQQEKYVTSQKYVVPSDLLISPDHNYFMQENYIFPHKQYPLIKKKVSTHLKPKIKPNIIFIVLESIGKYHMGPKPETYHSKNSATPFLDIWSKQAFSVSTFLANSDYTAGAEVSIFCSYHDTLRFSTGSGSILRDHTYMSLLCLPNILKKNGYDTFFFHSYTATFDNKHIFFPLHGIEHIIDRDHPAFKHVKKNDWGIDDKTLMLYSIQRMNRAKKPFFSIILTVNTHTPYLLHNNTQRKKFTPGNIQLNNYLNTVREADNNLRIFIQQIKKQTWFKNTIIIITADNGNGALPYTKRKLSTIEQFKITHDIPFLMYTINPSYKIPIGTVSKRYASQVDIMPTILDIMGIELENPFVGESLFSKNRKKEIFLYDWFNCYYLLTNDQFFYSAHTKSLFNFNRGHLLNKKNITLNSYETRIKTMVAFYNNLILKNNVWFNYNAP